MTKRLKLLLGILIAVIVVAVGRWATAPRPGPGHVYAMAAERSAEQGNQDEAIARWKQAVMAEPDNGDFHGELAAAYLALGKHDLAAAQLQMAAYYRPQRAHVYCQLAQALVEERRRDEALEALEKALRDTPDCPLALSVQGEQFLRDDNLKEALSAFERVIHLQPGFALAYQKAGYILLSTNRTEEALEVLQRGQIISPDDPGLHALLGQAHAQRPNDPEARRLTEEHLQQALKNNPEAAKAHAALGRLYLRSNDLEAAREQYQKALALQPFLGDGLYGISQVARRQGRAEEAERYLKVLKEGQEMERTIRDLQARALAQPENVDIRLRIARECLRNGLLSEAGRALDQGVAADPGRRDLRELRARWYLLSGKEERAARESSIASRLPRTP